MSNTMPLPIVVGQIEHRPLDQLIAYPTNARTHSRRQISQIAASISEFGFVNPILIGPDNAVIAWSGTTLVACERPKRRARLLEINPRHADAICQRWQQFTSKPAILAGDGCTFEDVANQRQQKAA